MYVYLLHFKFIRYDLTIPHNRHVSLLCLVIFVTSFSAEADNPSNIGFHWYAGLIT